MLEKRQARHGITQENNLIIPLFSIIRINPRKIKEVDFKIITVAAAISKTHRMRLSHRSKL